MAALSGATTYSVDMSHTYLEWAQENFRLNQIDLARHFFKEYDVLQFIQQAPEWPDFARSFDTIFLDPPTFSNSKSMKTDFDVERDQVFLITHAAKLLKPNGTLFFSNNKRDFKLSKQVMDEFNVKITTKQSIPQDFHDQKIHNSYEIRLKKN
jgi:23S rRNA (cytosine1962-C5)-methyltransferase/23S rRNA (guanine2445-N2)-methyltransferase / 23S rRNA (guanine2069-N7)-methyltransferase